MLGADHHYYRRIMLAIGIAVAATALLLLWPRTPGPRVNRVEPVGQDASLGAIVQLHFAGDVDQTSVERALRLEPPVELQLSWQNQTLIATPLQPLTALTEYRIVLDAGAATTDGSVTTRPQQWRFTTRGSRLLAVRPLPDGAAELWLIDPLDSSSTLLTTVTEGVNDLVVGPQGSHALIVVPRDRQRSALELLDLSDGSRRVLIDDPAAGVAAPAWSAYDDLIAFERRTLVDGVLGLPHVWLTQIDGQAAAPLLPTDARTPAFAPVWSPDGNRLALLDVMSQQVLLYNFFSDRVTALPLYSGERVSWLPDSSGFVAGSAAADSAGLLLQLERYDLADGRVTALTDPAQAALSPVVAAQDSRLAYIGRAPAVSGAAVWLLEGSRTRQLGRSGDWQDTLPAWSPDAARLAVVRLAADAVGSIVVIDPVDGTEQIVFRDAMQFVWLP